jgi:phage regulator Rha-like protein
VDFEKMNMLSTATQTMTSRDLLSLINNARVQNNEPEIRLNKFNEKIEDELEGDYYTKSVVQNPNNTESVICELTQDQCMLLAMRESKAVRRTVLEKLKTVQQALPQNYAQAMRLAADLYEQNEQLAIERDHAVATKSQISDKKTATALNTASQAVKKLKKVEAELGRCVENATIIAVKKLTGTEYAWQPLRKWCKAQGVKPIEVVDARYGLVKSWPSAAWFSVFGVILEDLFTS